LLFGRKGENRSLAALGSKAVNPALLRRDEFDAEFAGAGAVEFGEEDDLPATKSEAALLDEYRFGGADERRLDVRVGVPFCVLEEGTIRDEAIERAFHVPRDIGIVAFIYDDAGGGVRDVEMAKAGLDAGIANEAFDFGCDVLEFCAARGADRDFV
jgi:hypothetical protein